MLLLSQCSFQGCSGLHHAQGFCKSHYGKLCRRRRSLRPAKVLTLQQRFDKHVQFDTNGAGCWFWGSHLDKHGYARLTIEKRTVFAHRVSWELHHGKPIPAGLMIRHQCHQRCCINPHHLEIGTAQDNSDDCAKAGRCPRGSQRSSAKLDEDAVREIKGRLKRREARKRIAADYGVSAWTIEKVATGEHWRHVQ